LFRQKQRALGPHDIQRFHASRRWIHRQAAL
jgi:hypothetical protein